MEIQLQELIDQIKNDGVIVKHKDGKYETIKCDSVITSIGYNPAPVTNTGVHVIGDAASVGNLRTVIWGAWDVAMKI